jgi:hypothetical protein
MSSFVRRAGSARLEDGSTVIWTISEGRRGRRWREVRTGEAGAVVGSLLLETDPIGRFLHAELSTAAGLLTLHPEGDGTLHGNVVTAGGVRHVTGLRWSADAALLVEGSVIAAAAAAHATRERTDVGASKRLFAARVSVGLDVAIGYLDVERLAIDRWRVDGHEVRVDPNGLPAPTEGRTWPLELQTER